MARVTHDAADRDRAVAQTRGATSERSARRADAVRNRTAILEAAKQLVTEKGAEVAMGEIARVAGVAVGTLYRHFPNKADLLAAVVNEYVEALADDAFADVCTPGNPRPATREDIKALYTSLL